MDESRSTEINAACPHCGYRYEVTTSFEDKMPTSGAFSLCFKCLR